MARILLVYTAAAHDSTPPVILRDLLRQHGHHVLGPAATAAEAEELFCADPPDLLLLDVHLAAGADGIALGSSLSNCHPVPLIFLTAAADQATYERAREVGPFAFLNKPCDPVLLVRTIELALRKFAGLPVAPAPPENTANWLASGALYVREHNRYVRLVLQDVARIEADNAHIHLYTAGRKYTVRAPLREFEERLPPRQFVRVHRSWVVRLSAIEEVRYPEGQLLVAGSLVPFSRTFRDELRQRLAASPAPTV